MSAGSSPWTAVFADREEDAFAAAGAADWASASAREPPRITATERAMPRWRRRAETKREAVMSAFLLSPVYCRRKILYRARGAAPGIDYLEETGRGRGETRSRGLACANDAS